MNCMKCGKEMSGNQHFCEQCLEEMEKYPVKPNTVVQIPVRPFSTPAKRKTKRSRFIRPEDEIRFLRKRIRWLSAALVVSVLAFALTAAATLFLLEDKEIPFDIGQNYGTTASTEGT